MMSVICEDVEVNTPSPGSPPGMTASKSSKSSSFQSLHSDDGSILEDVSHFEDIGLDDDESVRFHDPLPKSTPKPFSTTYPSDLRAASAKHAAPRSSSNPPRDLAARSRPTRDLASIPKTRPPLTVQTQTQTLGSRNGTHVPKPQSSPISLHFAASRSTSSLIPSQRRRSPSPNVVRGLRDPPVHLLKPRRSSWQSTRDRKSSIDLEKECDDDDGDDIPDGLILDNVPISPRPPHERPKPPSPRTESRPQKERVRSVGNGTPPVAVARGSLRSPTWRSDTQIETAKSLPPSPLKARSKSWNVALSELSAETKALTEKLEEHAEELYKETGSSTNRRRSLELPNYAKPRVRSAMAELPPLQRGNIMIDPLPISKEKEAVLSRTRPSWLPPKDPAEEKKHLREYQKMMAHSLEVDKRREAAKRARSACRDTAADSLIHIWENEIIPRWDQAIRERRTRELWWKGVVPRCRGAVWTRAIGNDLGLSETSYDAALKRANEADNRAKSGKGSGEDMRRSEWFRSIRRDVEQHTFTELKIFQAGGPLHQSLIDVLSAYAMYRSDIGYIKGCNTIAAILMLNLPTPTASFIALANVLNRPLPLSFYASDPGAKASAYNLLLQTLAQKSPRLYAHLDKLDPDHGHDPDVYLGSAFNGLFTTHLVLDEAARLWDVYVFEGDAVLVRAGVALLLRREMELLAASSLDEVKEILAKTSKGRAKIVGSESNEEAWIKALREAGKA